MWEAAHADGQEIADVTKVGEVDYYGGYSFAAWRRVKGEAATKTSWEATMRRAVRAALNYYEARDSGLFRHGPSDPS